jgi:outer membrane protein assembly factor BamB
MMKARSIPVFSVLLIAITFMGCTRPALKDSPKTDQAWHGGNWPTYQLSADHNAVLKSADAPAHPKWSVDLKAKINGGLAYSGGLLYVATFDHRIVAFKVLDGSIAWQQTFDNIIMSTPVISANAMVIGTGDNGMTAGSEEPFAYANLLQNREPFWGREGGDHVIAIDPSNGKVRWSFHTAGEDMPSPVIVGDHVVFANGDAHAYGVKLKSGEIEWQTIGATSANHC